MQVTCKFLELPSCLSSEGCKPVQIDYESGEPVYLQIARLIRDQIIKGELPVGAQIPTGRSTSFPSAPRTYEDRQVAISTTVAGVQLHDLLWVESGTRAWWLPAPAGVRSLSRFQCCRLLTCGPVTG